MKKLLNPSLVLCATLFLAADAPAQEKRPAPNKATPPAPQKAAPTPAPTPRPTPAPEPFDGATVEQMAAQCVRLETEAGTIEMKMLPQGAPESVRNFLNLAATGAFDTTTFSRVVRGFVIQGGNLSTREKLTPALAERARRTVRDEPNAIRHVRGVVSMARSDRPNSATTNFFILVDRASHLDGKFAAFGRVTKGMDVVDGINKAALEGETPLTPVRIGSTAVFACAANTAAPPEPEP
ncbi:MAG TPA: peptidylprolyl isomerase [Pyrinomonadaceae bacterium]|nr:peptidylprolyl isomerase [Pyrinomonadaceae bacterium]